MGTKIECACGQRVLLPETVTRGKCPRCGRILEARPEPLPTRAIESARSQQQAAASALPWILCAGLGLVSLLLTGGWLSLLGSQNELERRLDAMVEKRIAADEPREKPEPPPDRELPGTPPASDSEARVQALTGQVARLETDLAALSRRVSSSSSTPPSSSPPVADRPPPVPSSDLEAQVMKLANTVSPAIVSIQNGASVGSGVLISKDGYLLTNDHVVSGAGSVAVQLSNGDTYTGRVLGTDTYSDVACVRIEGRDFPALRLGDSDSLAVGQIVAALGNPFGISRDGSPTVTLGILSALHRVIPLSGDRQYRDAIQTDAAINPGNSGGALVDLEGRLIGINGAITSTTGTNSGIGFAIPINFVKRILPTLEAGRSPEPGFMGISLGELSLDDVKRMGFRGALIDSVTRGSPAFLAGLRAKDVIKTFQGESVESSTRLLNLISYYQVGETVELEYWREGTVKECKVTVGRRPR